MALNYNILILSKWPLFFQYRVWYSDFHEFAKKEKLFATLLTPQTYGSEQTHRWDTYRTIPGLKDLIDRVGQRESSRRIQADREAAG